MNKNEDENLIKRASLFLLKLLYFTIGSFLTVESMLGPQLLPKSTSNVLFVFSSIYLVSILMYDFVTDRFQKRENYDSKIIEPSHYKLLKLSGLLFSSKTQKDVFEQIIVDWDLEIYEAIEKQETNKMLMVNLRNSYRFLLAMWLRSPIGDLIEFVIKIAKK